MSQIINLRTHRKQSERAAKRRAADAQAARHGRSKAERMAQTAQADKARAHLDAHLLTGPETPDQSVRPAPTPSDMADSDSPDPTP